MENNVEQKSLVKYEEKTVIKKDIITKWWFWLIAIVMVASIITAVTFSVKYYNLKNQMNRRPQFNQQFKGMPNNGNIKGNGGQQGGYKDGQRPGNKGE